MRIKAYLGKIGPIIVHASMIIILVGSVLGTLVGYVARISSFRWSYFIYKIL